MNELTKHKNPNWTENELKMAISLYGKIPFKSSRKTSPEIVKWAKVIGRSPGGLYTKLCNLGRCDKAMQNMGVKGLSHGGKLEPIIWKQFEEDPERIIFEGQQLLAERMNVTVEEFSGIDTKTLPTGKERKVTIRQRVGQSFFREAVLSAYNNHCCITGISNSPLLEACHISGWADDTRNRTNPKNGLCMTPTFHRAYDKYLLAITPDYEIVVSEQMIEGAENEQTRRYLTSLQRKKMLMPEKFAPNVELLAQHYDAYLKAAV